MKYIDSTLWTPHQNVALDEALLNYCEENSSEEILRFWSFPRYFVVLGYSNKINEVTAAAQCEKDDVPLIRRCSGGGTVLQGPGCFNYSVVLQITRDTQLKNVTATNQYVMQRHQQVFEELLGKSVQVQGHTDLTVGSLKFSGNAQRRRSKTVLFHGTFLLDFDFEKITNYLLVPKEQPEYREGRPHKDFLMNISVTDQKIKTALKKCWQASSEFNVSLDQEVNRLLREQYEQRDWNYKF